jgi:GTP-binding protein HflX
VVALVGYTNAGKSTLLNTLANSDVYTANQLFATLDPTTRQVELKDGQLVLLTDTVGFIQKLPTQLIASFRATLEEIAEANLLLHIVDASNPAFEMQRVTVLETLKEIEADELPVITVYNKIDLLSAEEMEKIKHQSEPVSAFISAKEGLGVEDLIKKITDQLLLDFEVVDVLLPYVMGQLVSTFHEKGKILTIENLEQGIRIQGYLPKQLLASFEPYRTKKLK